MTPIQALCTACRETFLSMLLLQPKQQNTEQTLAFPLDLVKNVLTEFTYFSRDMVNNITIVQVGSNIKLI